MATTPLTCNAEDTKSSKSCTFCRTQKIKCSRCLPACSRCQKTGRACVYTNQSSLKIRNQTDQAAERAVRLWRSRASKFHSEPLQASRPPSGIDLAVDGLARLRLIYDFAVSAFHPMLHDILAEHETMPCRQKGFLALTFDAVALANFGRRQNDKQSLALAADKQRLAIASLRTSLAAPDGFASEVTSAVLLMCLYQTICQDPNYAGSWVHHFCGAMSLTDYLEPGTSHYRYLQELLVMQGAYASFQLCVPIRFPQAAQNLLESDASTLLRATKLLYWATKLCCREKNKDFRVRKSDEATSLDATILEHELQNLEFDLLREAPFYSRPNEPENHATWWRYFSLHPGSPPVEHIYTSVLAAASWNTYRLARLALVEWVIQSQAELGLDVTRISALDQGATLIDDMCGSFYYSMVPDNDNPTVDSFNKVRTCAGYGPHLRFESLVDILSGSEQHCRLLLKRVGNDKLEWIAKIVEIISKELGVGEVLMWEKGNETERRATLAKLVDQD